jgi:uncharacterized RDD family membrane protein YckC
MENVTYAGFWKRVAALIIDMIILWIPLSFFTKALSNFGIDDNTQLIIDLSFQIVVWALYYGILESSSRQATFGKHLFGLRVMSDNGERLSFLRAMSRHLCQYIAGIPLGLGIFMVGWTKKKQGLHDIMTKSIVVFKPTSSLTNQASGTPETGAPS